MYKSETTWEVGVAGSSYELDMHGDVECGAIFPGQLKSWAGVDIHETLFVETIRAVDIASQEFGKNRPETT